MFFLMTCLLKYFYNRGKTSKNQKKIVNINYWPKQCELISKTTRFPKSGTFTTHARKTHKRIYSRKKGGRGQKYQEMLGLLLLNHNKG